VHSHDLSRMIQVPACRILGIVKLHTLYIVPQSLLCVVDKQSILIDSVAEQFVRVQTEGNVVDIHGQDAMVELVTELLQ
jgi:hypothetical protein